MKHPFPSILLSNRIALGLTQRRMAAKSARRLIAATGSSSYCQPQRSGDSLDQIRARH